MPYALSFAVEFFWGTVPIEKMKPSPRPTSVYQAVLSLSHERWAELARDVFNCHSDNLDVETVLDQILAAGTCENLDSPVRIYIELDGLYSILVYEEKP